MANNQTPKLRAFVRIDGSGRVVPGAPILQAFKPKVGQWREIPLYYRGDTTSTSTTGGGGGGNQPTAWLVTGYASQSDGCNNINPITTVVYTASSTLADWTPVWQDAALTIPIDNVTNGNNIRFTSSPEYSNCLFNITGSGTTTWIYSCTQCF